jgi:hypothetical protein
MTGRRQTLPWWLGAEGVKTTENKIHWPRWRRTSMHDNGKNVLYDCDRMNVQKKKKKRKRRKTERKYGEVVSERR